MKVKVVILGCFLTLFFIIVTPSLCIKETKPHLSFQRVERSTDLDLFEFSDSQKQQLKQLFDAIQYHLDFAVEAVDQDGTLFSTWFHPIDAAFVKRKLASIRSIVTSIYYYYIDESSSADCQVSGGFQPIAYKTRGDDTTIYICPVFFSKPPLVGTSTGTQLEAIVHELAHMVLPDEGTDIYGERASKLLARRPGRASNNADNYAYFVRYVNPFHYKWDSQMQMKLSTMPTYITSGPTYVRISGNSGTIDCGYPKLLKDLGQELGMTLHESFLQGFDAMATDELTTDSEGVYIFRGNQYLYFDQSTGRTSGPHLLSEHFTQLSHGFEQGIDAAFSFGELFLFKGNQVITYSLTSTNIVSGYEEISSALSESGLTVPDGFDGDLDTAKVDTYELKFCFSKAKQFACLDPENPGTITHSNLKDRIGTARVC